MDKKTLQKPEGAEFVNSLNYLADGTINMLKKIINLAFILMISFAICSCSAKSEAEPERGRKVEQNEQKVGNETTSEALWIKKRSRSRRERNLLIL